MSVVKIAVATGNEELNQLLMTSLPSIYEPIEVHYRSFLITHDFEVVITSNLLKGNLEIQELLFEMKKKGLRIIFLTNKKAKEEISHCMSFGIHDLLWQDITKASILHVLNHPNEMKDVAHLIEISGDERSHQQNKVDQKAGKKKGKYSGLPFMKQRSNTDKSEDDIVDAKTEPTAFVHRNETTTPPLKNEKESRQPLVEPLTRVDKAHKTDGKFDKFIDQNHDLFGDEPANTETPNIANDFFDKLDEIKPEDLRVEAEAKEIKGESKVHFNQETTKKVKSDKKAGTYVVAFSGMDNKVGTTHSALLYAYSMIQEGYKHIAIVSMKDHDDTFNHIREYYVGRKSSKVFSFKGVKYYKEVDEVYSEMTNFDLIVLDMGVYKGESTHVFYKMALRKYLVCDGAIYREDEWLRFVKEHAGIIASFTYLLPLATKDEMREFRIFMETNNVHTIPYNKAFMSPNEETVLAYSKVTK